MKNKELKKYYELKKLGRSKTKIQRQEFIILKAKLESEKAKRKLKETHNNYLINLAKSIIYTWARKDHEPKYLNTLKNADEIDYLKTQIAQEKSKFKRQEKNNQIYINEDKPEQGQIAQS